MTGNIPKILIFSRLLIGIVILILTVVKAETNTIIIILISIGLLTDIFDGIIARRLKISTQALRRLDSSIDQVFWLLIATAAFIKCKDFFYKNYYQLIILIAIELLTYVISFIKFRKEISTHAIASKVWTLILFAALIQIITTCDSKILFQLCFYVGVITRFEIIAILFILKKWTSDVPTLYHAIQLRKGKEIKRHKLFNG